MAALRGSRRRTWTLSLANVAIALAVFVILALSPAPVHFPGTHWEAVLLAIGALVLLVSNGVIAAAAAAAAVQRGRAAADDSVALQELRACEHFHVVTDEGVVGVVDEVIAARDGQPAGLVVGSGWLRSRRSFVPLEDIVSVRADARELVIVDRAPAGPAD